ncbi:phosphotransferase family protein [Streptomyces enissocaesilis]|uniref:Phosphotransferase family protein n=1 Tax=Streptomyces enissocaesilis TaxID=332589 RepID=A0ABN3XB30_9ACTN
MQPVDADWATDWLTSCGLQVSPPLTAQRIGAGLSNLTYRIEDHAARAWVLRRPPSGKLLASAHDVLREARIVDALSGTAVPVPRIYGARHNATGVPWVLMEHLGGVVIDDMDTAARTPIAERASIGLDMATTLGHVHAVDLEETRLQDLASHNPYAPRQLKRWNRQWEASKTGELPALDSLSRRLERAMPAQEETTLVHGDFHIKNVITDHGTIVGVLDWELSTLGNPLADLGTLLAYWPAHGESDISDRTSASTLPGFPSRAELIDQYATTTGRDTSDVGFWHVLGLWKIAIIAEGVLRRSLDTPADRARTGVPTRDVITSIVSYAHAIADDASL